MDSAKGAPTLRKGQIASFSGFSWGGGGRRFSGPAASGPGFAYRNLAPGACFGPKGRAAFNFLLCMFNGFAFARPLCGWIKVNLTGVGIRLVVLCVRWGNRARAVACRNWGTTARNGVHQPIYLPHDVRCVP